MFRKQQELIRQQQQQKDETYLDDENSYDYFGHQREEEGRGDKRQPVKMGGIKSSNMKPNNRSKKKSVENLKKHSPHRYQEADHRAEEEHLQELERLAGRSYTHEFDQRSFSRNSYDSNSLAYSDTETDFMIRQKTADNFNPPIQSQVSPVDVNEIDALQERLLTLEKQITTLVAAIERKEGEQEKTEDKLRRTLIELEAFKRASNSNKVQVENNQERALILLKEQHLKDMAQMTSSLSLAPSSPTKYGEGVGNTSIGGPAGGGGRESHRHLLAQLDMLRAEQKRAQDQILEERREYQIEGSNRLLAQERMLKVEINDLRQQKISLEDRFSQLSEDFTVVNAKAESFRILYKQLEDSRDMVRAEFFNIHPCTVIFIIFEDIIWYFHLPNLEIDSEIKNIPDFYIMKP